MYVCRPMYVRTYVRARAHTCVRARARVRARACVRARVRARVRALRLKCIDECATVSYFRYMYYQKKNCKEVSVSVSARYCIPQCVRLIAGGGGG